MYTLINGSPKKNSSNSNYFLNIISKHLDKYNLFNIKNKKYDEILNSINESDSIILSFPLYVDSPPSILLEFLDYIIDQKINLNKKYVYVIINCGFREGKQNLTALEIIKNWCKEVNATYASIILIGAGEIVGKEKYKFISRKALKNLEMFATTIKNHEIKEKIITTMDFLNNKAYILLGNYSWNKNAKLNGLTKENLISK